MLVVLKITAIALALRGKKIKSCLTTIPKLRENLGKLLYVKDKIQKLIFAELISGMRQGFYKKSTTTKT